MFRRYTEHTADILNTLLCFNHGQVDGDLDPKCLTGGLCPGRHAMWKGSELLKSVDLVHLQ